MSNTKRTTIAERLLRAQQSLNQAKSEIKSPAEEALTDSLQEMLNALAEWMK